MNRRLHSIILILTVLAAFSLALQADAHGASLPDGSFISSKYLGQKDGVGIVKITYASDGLKVNGMMFIAPSDQKAPCVIFCHDGITGISKEHRFSAIRLAKQGYAVFCPSYRGEDGSEGEVEIAKGEVKDVLAAITLVKKIKGVDGDHIALAGASHGALICLLAASRTDAIDGLVCAYGVCDIYKWWDYLKENNKLGKDKYTKNTYGDGPEDRPVSFAIRNGVTFAGKVKCPVLILQGEKDDIVPPDQAKYLKAALDKAKVRNDCRLYADCLHGFLIYAPYDEKADPKEKAQTEEAWKTMLDFFKENLKGNQG